MSRVFILGIGAVSPAGWSAGALADALQKNRALPTTLLARPEPRKALRVRTVSKPVRPLPCLSHPRLRRVSAITQYVIAAASEAMGEEAVRIRNGELRLGIVVCLMPGCVTYSRRFYEEVLKDPATASPLLFSETVFHAPASHLAATLNAEAESYTLVGDESAYLEGLALGASWLARGQVDRCIVVGAEEMDWIVADAVDVFEERVIHSEGAGALYLSTGASRPNAVELCRITDAFPFSGQLERMRAAQDMYAELGPALTDRELLCESSHGLARWDRAEKNAWRDWNGERLAPRLSVGDAFTASAAWQCCVAGLVLASGEFDSAAISVVGTNQQAIGARFVRVT